MAGNESADQRVERYRARMRRVRLYLVLHEACLLACLMLIAYFLYSHETRLAHVEELCRERTMVGPE
jgi:hypothetical protein